MDKIIEGLMREKKSMRADGIQTYNPLPVNSNSLNLIEGAGENGPPGAQPNNTTKSITHQSTTQRQKVVFCWIDWLNWLWVELMEEDNEIKYYNSMLKRKELINSERVL